MKLPRLYAISDETIIPNNRMLESVEEVLQAGVRLFQVRFKKTPYPERLELGRKLRELTTSYEALFIVNDSPELARELEADGVHLGADDPQVLQAREVVGPQAIIGVSCYDQPQRVSRWGPEHISHLGMATPYPSSTKPKVNPDLKKFSGLVSLARVPVYAIGGVTPECVAELMKVGCYGVAVVSSIFGADDPSRAVKLFLKELGKFSEI